MRACGCGAGPSVTASDRDLTSGPSAPPTDDEALHGRGGGAGGLSRMDVEEDEYEEVRLAVRAASLCKRLVRQPVCRGARRSRLAKEGDAAETTGKRITLVILRNRNATSMAQTSAKTWMRLKSASLRS